MRSLRLRLTLWFGVSFVLVVAVFMAVTYVHLRHELIQERWERAHPDHPDWVLHGSFSESEVQDILHELIKLSLLYSIPFVVAALIASFFLAKKSLRPVADLNAQLQRLGARDLGRKLVLPEADAEFRDLLVHLNDLLGRLDRSFAQLNEYSAKVAHELRTPLTILRLKIEQAAGKIAPELAEEVQDELHRLTHYVEQSLLVARAEHGRLELQEGPTDLVPVLQDVTADFQLLCEQEGRELRFTGPPSARIRIDVRYARQVLHGLLGNALRHGRGPIHLRLHIRRRQLHCRIFNRRTRPPSTAQDNHTIGLRVIRAILDAHGDVQYRVRHDATRYLVHLTCPLTQESSATKNGPSHAPASGR
jgi:signal transduction histidine kinase